MKIHRLVSLLAVSLFIFGTIHCGGGDGGSSDDSSGSGISSIGDLPHATDPVVGSGGSSLIKSAVTGIGLGSMDSSTFDADSSIAACEMSNRFKEGITSAANGDKILCYVQNVVEANSDVAVDPYDGSFHVFGLDFGDAEGEEAGPSKVRMKIVRDADGNITEFVMYACGDSGSEDEQSEYISQTIDADGNFAMVSKGMFEGDDGWSGSHQVEVTGTLNASGQFTGEKVIELASTWSGSGGDDGSGEATMTQASDSVTYNGWESGSYSGDGGDGTFENRVYAAAELIDGNSGDDAYDIGLLAVGDGAAHAILNGSFGGDEWGPDDVVQGWNGDTTEEDADAAADYITAVEDQTPAAIGEVAIAFEGDEVYDCADEVEATVSVDTDALDAACSNLDLGYEWINCWEIAGE